MMGLVTAIKEILSDLIHGQPEPASHPLGLGNVLPPAGTGGLVASPVHEASGPRTGI